MIATNLELFQTTSALPLMLDPSRLDDAGDEKDTLIKNKAKYHRSSVD